MKKLISLHRYYIWANRMRIKFDEAAMQEVASQNPNLMFITDAMIFMSYWYSALFVVVEGWGKLRLSDSRVGALLSSPNVSILKDYRHGVCHFHPEYFDTKFMNFIEAKAIVPWVRELNCAFGAYFLARLGSPAQNEATPK